MGSRTTRRCLRLERPAIFFERLAIRPRSGERLAAIAEGICDADPARAANLRKARQTLRSQRQSDRVAEVISNVMTVNSVDPIDDTSDLELGDGLPVMHRVREPIEPLKMVYGCRIINR